MRIQKITTNKPEKETSKARTIKDDKDIYLLKQITLFGLQKKREQFIHKYMLLNNLEAKKKFLMACFQNFYFIFLRTK